MISGFFPARKRLQHHAGLKHSPVAHDLDMNPTAQIIAPERVSVIVPGDILIALGGQHIRSGDDYRDAFRRPLWWHS